MRKSVLITGASSGIGREIVRILASSYDVIIHYNNNYESALELKKEIDNKYNRDFLMVKSNLNNEEEIDNMLKVIYDRYNNIDVLINNAGIAIDSLFEDKTKENFIKVLDTNLVAPFLLSKKIGLKMKDNKNGIIINISSTNGIDTPYIESIDYDASKAGIISLTHNFAYQLAPYITVNAVAPGWIDTPMNKNMDEDYKKKEEDKIYLKRFADPKEIANVIFFLASDKASYINSSVIRVDGGCIHE